MLCIQCNAEVEDTEPARYDVLNPDYMPPAEGVAKFGPYDAECFANTVTGAQTPDLD